MAVLKLVWAGVLTLVLAGAVSGLWAGLLTLNLRTAPTLPWAAAVMAIVLWLAWLYGNGRGWPQRTADSRRSLLRARRIDSSTFALALVCGGLSLVALTGGWILGFQSGLMRGNNLPDFSQDPIQMVVVVIAMAAVVGA